MKQMLTPWLWPSEVPIEANWAKRLGRLLHWGCVLGAVIALAAGVTATASSYVRDQPKIVDLGPLPVCPPRVGNVISEDEAFGRCRRTSLPLCPPHNGRSFSFEEGAGLCTTSRTVATVQASGAPTPAWDSLTPIGQAPPTTQQVSIVWLLQGLGLAAILLLVGRGLRYLVAAE